MAGNKARARARDDKAAEAAVKLNQNMRATKTRMTWKNYFSMMIVFFLGGFAYTIFNSSNCSISISAYIPTSIDISSSFLDNLHRIAISAPPEMKPVKHMVDNTDNSCENEELHAHSSSLPDNDYPELHHFKGIDDECTLVAISSNIVLVANESFKVQILSCSSTDKMRLYPNKPLLPGIVLGQDGTLQGKTQTSMKSEDLKLCWTDATHEACTDVTLQVLSSLHHVKYPREILKLNQVRLILLVYFCVLDGNLATLSIFQRTSVQDYMKSWVH
eukprot:748309-Hanusia_phi.AAC.16